MPNFTISATTLTFPDGTTMTTAAQSIPSGTVTNFFQATAPTAWTKLTTNDNAAIRIVSGTGGGTGGSVNFNTAFASQTPAGNVSISGGSVSGYTLSTSEIPSHSHSYSASYNNIGDSNFPATAFAPGGGQSRTPSTSGAGGGGSHSHGFSPPTGSFSGSALNLAVKYLDNIMCSKN